MSDDPAAGRRGGKWQVVGTKDDRQAVGFQLVQMHFEQSGSISSCSSLTGAASGHPVMSKTQYELLGPDDKAVLPDGTPFPGSQFVIDCTGVQDIDCRRAVVR